MSRFGYDDDDDANFAIDYRCPSCGRTWQGDAYDSGACDCGTVAGQSYDSDDASRWNEAVGRRASWPGNPR